MKSCQHAPCTKGCTTTATLVPLIAETMRQNEFHSFTTKRVQQLCHGCPQHRAEMRDQTFFVGVQGKPIIFCLHFKKFSRPGIQLLPPTQEAVHMPGTKTDVPCAHKSCSQSHCAVFGTSPCAFTNLNAVFGTHLWFPVTSLLEVFHMPLCKKRPGNL